MKKFAKSMLGVTLLEIMLVLAIAAMIIVMSVRYYQTASAGQQANAMLAQIQSIQTAADGLAQGSGSYSTGGVDTASVKQLMPNNSNLSPWGGTWTIGTVADSNYQITFDNVPAQVCAQVLSRMKANPKYDMSGVTCPATGTYASFAFTYNANN